MREPAGCSAIVVVSRSRAAGACRRWTSSSTSTEPAGAGASQAGARSIAADSRAGSSCSRVSEIQANGRGSLAAHWRRSVVLP